MYVIPRKRGESIAIGPGWSVRMDAISTESTPNGINYAQVRLAVDLPEGMEVWADVSFGRLDTVATHEDAGDPRD